MTTEPTKPLKKVLSKQEQEIFEKYKPDFSKLTLRNSMCPSDRNNILSKAIHEAYEVGIESGKYIGRVESRSKAKP